MSNTKLDARQTISRDLLGQLFPNVPGQQLDLLLRSINADLTSPLRVDATSTPSLVVNIDASVVANAVSGRTRSANFVNGTSILSFNSGTATFPSTSGGNIVASTGASATLTLPSGEYVYVLLCIDGTGAIQFSIGTPNTVLANATVPIPVSSTMPFAYVAVHNTGGTIDNIIQSAITQLEGGGGGGSSSSSAGSANEVNVSSGSTSVTVTFGVPLATTAYIPIAQFRNSVDAHPKFQQIVITNKTINGFTASWNEALDTSNYFLGYIVPQVQEQIGNASLSSGATSITVTLPFPLASTSYVVLAEMANFTDTTPQYQTVQITAKTTTTFTASWNTPLDTSNYRLNFHAAAYQ